MERPLDAHRLAGTADRLEIRADGAQVVVDYKTGRVPRQAEVESLEAVQLLHYAALDPAIAAVEYLPLKDGVRPVVIVENLSELRDALTRRLGAMLHRLGAQAALPAHGDDEVCEHCDYQGLCRKGSWRDE